MRCVAGGHGIRRGVGYLMCDSRGSAVRPPPHPPQPPRHLGHRNSAGHSLDAASRHPQHYHSPSSSSPPSPPSRGLQDRLQTGRGLDLRTTTNGALLQILCILDTIDYATARTAGRVRINPYYSLAVSIPSEPRVRLYLRVSELRLGPTSYPRPAYMAAPDNYLRGIIYNAVDCQTQGKIVEDLQSMNVNTPYAIADACQMGHSISILITFVGTTTLPSAIVFNCGIYRCHPFHPKAEACTNCCVPGHCVDVCIKPKSAICHRCGQAHKAVEPPACVPCCILCKGAHVTGSRPSKLRFDQNGPSSPPATSKPQHPPPAPSTGPIHKTSWPSSHRSAFRGSRSASRHRSVSFPPLPRSEASTAPTTTSPVNWKSQPHTSDPQTAALKATIAAQQIQIQELSRQLQAALARLSSPAPSPRPCPAPAPSQTTPQMAPAEAPMNTAPSAASSRASSPSRRPPHKCRSPSSDDVAPERETILKTACFLEAFEQRVMARFARLEERVASVDNRTPGGARLRPPSRTSRSPPPSLRHLPQLRPTLLADVRAATSTLPAAPNSTTAASRLLHLWEANHLVHRRWQAQKHNRLLRLRLARLASDMEEHCSSLLRQQWGLTCDRMAGKLGLRDTWWFLRVLPDPTHTIASHLLHTSPLTDTDFLAALHAVATHAQSVGLSCSPAKLKLFLLLPRGIDPLSPSPLIVSLDGIPFPLVPTLRILGLFLQSNGKYTTHIHSTPDHPPNMPHCQPSPRHARTPPPPPSPGLCSQPLHLFSFVYFPFTHRGRQQSHSPGV
ncbi:hypothetical protein HPB49_005435 [Dermacentor silvarum]|uniref:Uncharacterized protein n=1 Tax=Dermacentor silvarum TaxID=543639 RepID=A0ACB8D361_DERSI|nr:hypothetical protein HPB49_005435 [Dermacentor silvarum]